MVVTSLSNGVLGLVEGQIMQENIEFFISGTKFSSPEKAIEFYSQTSWKGKEKEAAEICKKLWPVVIQPRQIFGDQYTPIPGIYKNLDEAEKACEHPLLPNCITALKEAGYLK